MPYDKALYDKAIDELKEVGFEFEGTVDALEFEHGEGGYTDRAIRRLAELDDIVSDILRLKNAIHTAMGR